MPACRYHIVNVYSEAPLAGLPVAVFDQSSLLDAATMQALALQLQAGITVFLLPSARAHARLSIFNPERALTFSPDALLAAATVLREQTGNNLFSIETDVMVVPMWQEQERWFFQARAPGMRRCEVRPRHLAAMLSLSESDVDEPALFVNGGVEQLIVPLTNADAVKNCSPRLDDMALHAVNDHGQPQLLVWHRMVDTVVARSFSVRFGSLREEPACGASIAALGGYLLLTRAPLPITLRVRQGDHLDRPSRMALTVDDYERVMLGGQARIQLSGELSW